LLKSTETNQRLIRETFRISDRMLGDLRDLTPQASTGVTPAEWRKAVDAVRRDGRAFDSFFATEYPKLLRSFKKSNPTPKLPPGTGPTAATLAQAFNSPEGRRYLRLQRRLSQRMQADSKTMERISRKVGLVKACGDISVGQSQTTTATQQTP
jgi:hypothetical protein